MIFTENDIDFSRVDSRQFEEVCFDLLLKTGFHSLVWRQGGADSGRDIEAKFNCSNPMIGFYQENWFVECKHYTAGVPVSELETKFAWADACRPNHLLVVTSSYISNPARDWIEKISPSKTYKVSLLEGKQLKQLLLGYPEIISRYFISKTSKTLQEAISHWEEYGVFPSKEMLYSLYCTLDPRALTEYEICFLLSANWKRINEITSWFSEEDGVAFAFDYLVAHVQSQGVPDEWSLVIDDSLQRRLSIGSNELALTFSKHFCIEVSTPESPSLLEGLYLFLIDEDTDSGIEFLLTRTQASFKKPRRLLVNAKKQFETKFHEYMPVKNI